MAVAGNYSKTLEGGHEPFYDFTCSLCEQEDRNMEAVRYCEDCFVYLCDPCLKNHDKYPLNKRHRLLDQSKFVNVKSPLLSLPTTRCERHTGELINLFCGKHNVVCCSVCKALDHSVCVETQHLPEAAKGIRRSKEYEKIKSELKALISSLDKVMNNRKEDNSRIAKDKQRAKQTIAEFRKKINKYLDDIEKNSLDDLDHRANMILRDINSDKAYLEETKSKAVEIIKQLESFTGENECDLFVKVKAGHHFLNDSGDKLHHLPKNDQTPGIYFKVSKNIEAFFSSLKSFGSFSSTNLPELQKSSMPTLAPSVVTATPTQKQTDCGSLIKAQLIEKIDLHEKSGSRMHDIRSICQLPDGTFLVTDCNDETLKRLDQTLTLLGSLRLEGSPHSVCTAGPDEVAVSLLWSRKIQFVSVEKKLILEKSFTTDNFCRGIAYIGDTLFGCCGDIFDSSSGCIVVYNNTGKLQRTITLGQQNLSSVPFYITVSDDDQHLLVTCRNNNKVTMLDLTGNVVNTFSHRYLKEPKGICTDGKGRVLVCGYGSNTVAQVSPNDQKVEVLLRKSEGIKKPCGVFYDRVQSRLFVSCHDSDELRVFSCK